jgi:hypothetical protein
LLRFSGHLKGKTIEFKRDISSLKLQNAIGVKDREYFYEAYLNPALQGGFIEYTIPEKPKSKLQQYQLTQLGMQLFDKPWE